VHQTKTVLLKDVLTEARKMNPSRKNENIIKQLKFYSEVQVKTLRFSSDYDRSDIAFSKNQLAHLITDAFEPDYNWQNKQITFEPN
jgi:hypothetical protein